MKLKDYDRILTLVDSLLQIHQMIQDIDSGIRSRCFLKSIENLDAVHNLVGSLDVEEDIERNVQKVLRTEICVLRERLLFGLSETWNHLLKWTLPPDHRKASCRPRTAILEATDNEAEKEILASTVQAMHSVSMLEGRLKTFCDRVLRYFVESVITDRKSLLQVIDELERCTLRVIISPVPEHQREARQPVPPREAFQKLEQVFTFLHRPLCNIPVTKSSGGDSPATVTLVEQVGQLLCKRLFECIYNECLSHAVPQGGGAGQWDAYNELVALTEQFQDSLIRLKFLSPDHATLMDYLNNVNTLFANIKSQEILRRAHQFLTQELLSSVQISSESPLGKVKGQDGGATEEFVKECREQAGTSNLKLPKCQIR